MTQSNTMTEPEFEPLFHQINYKAGQYIASHYNPDVPVKERFITWWISFATNANDNPFDVVYMEQIATSHLYPYMGTQTSTAFFKESRVILAQGQAEGLIKNLDISFLNQFIRATVTSMIKTHISIGKTLTKEQIETMITICWDGIKTS